MGEFGRVIVRWRETKVGAPRVIGGSKWAVLCLHSRSPKARDRGHPQQGLIGSPGPGPPAPGLFGGFVGLTEVRPWLQSLLRIAGPTLGLVRFWEQRPSGAEALLYLGSPMYGLKRLRKKSGFESRFTKSIPRGLKPSVYFQPLAARLKPCPFKTSAIW